MTEFKFTCNSYGTETSKTFPADVLDDVFTNFGEFLRGSGYIFDGNVGILSDDCDYNPYDELVSRLKNDDSYADVFQANMVMAIYDGSRQKISHVDCNILADFMMSRIFGINHYHVNNIINCEYAMDNQLEFIFTD